MPPKSFSDYIRTDMAAELISANSAHTVKEETKNGFPIHRLVITDEITEGERTPPGGTYLTVTLGRLWNASKEHRLLASQTLASLIQELCKTLTHRDAPSVLVACLGNRRITADAIGPLCAENLLATRHLQAEQPELFRSLGSKSVSVISPGVIGDTGIESFELISAAVNSIHPELVIAIDALAARSSERLGTTVQLSDSGISPGSGVGNRRFAINRKTLGAPVISIGAPTVIHSSTLVYDALHAAGIDSLDERLTAILENEKSFFATPKECDLASQALAETVSAAVNLAFLGFPSL